MQCKYGSDSIGIIILFHLSTWWFLLCILYIMRALIQADGWSIVWDRYMLERYVKNLLSYIFDKFREALWVWYAAHTYDTADMCKQVCQKFD